MKPWWGLFLMAFMASACAVTPPDVTTLPPRFTPATFAELPGFDRDDGADFLTAAARSCERLMKRPGDDPIKPFGTVADFHPYCRAVLAPDAKGLNVITTHLQPWRVTIPGRDDGLFTGYYEASLKGSRTRHGPYQTPLRARPLDHVVVPDLRAFKPDLPAGRLTGQLKGEPGVQTLTPYPDRAGIVAGQIPAQADRVLVWVDDPVDAFFLEIQGSGRVQLDDGTVMHVGYAERNGQAYTAVGKVLVEHGVAAADQMSMQTIRAWMAANPTQAQDLMNHNQSYIFFRELPATGPEGAEGVPLTTLRSLAVDPRFWSYGVPFFVDAGAPSGLDTDPRVQRMMVAQDTGGAIKGAIRGDVYWGYGDTAEQNAGVMKSRGNFWILLPIGLDPRARD